MLRRAPPQWANRHDSLHDDIITTLNTHVWVFVLIKKPLTPDLNRSVPFRAEDSVPGNLKLTVWDFNVLHTDIKTTHPIPVHLQPQTLKVVIFVSFINPLFSFSAPFWASALHSGACFCRTGEARHETVSMASLLISSHKHSRPSHQPMTQKPPWRFQLRPQFRCCVRGPLTCELTWETRKWNSTARGGGVTR